MAYTSGDVKRSRRSVLAEISQKEFYGDAALKRNKVQGRYHHVPRHLLHPFRGTLTNGGHIWKVFARQNEAISYVSSAKDANLKLFSFEDVRNPDGRRYYLVCSVAHFWHDYSTTEPRHFYELISENTPCRLYFDVEFYYEFNPELNANAALRYFVTVVCEHINRTFHIDVSYQDVIDLDSSTDSKFSRHLIFHLPLDRLFASNAHMGRFVESVCEKLKEPILSTQPCTTGDNGLDEKDGHGMVLNSKQESIPICDRAVYSRNRNFRIFLSSKVGKPTPLRLADSCPFYSCRGVEKPTEKQIFSDSMICPQLPSVPPVDLLVFGDANMNSTETNPSTNSGSSLGRRISEHTGPSPKPEIDRFILKLAVKPLKGNRNAWIRSWRRIFDDSTDLVIYEIGGCRFCWNIGREHRSNHVKYVADVRRMICYQKCHDPDCKEFRSNEFPIGISPQSDVERLIETPGEDTLTDESFVRHVTELEESGIV